MRACLGIPQKAQVEALVVLVRLRVAAHRRYDDDLSFLTLKLLHRSNLDFIGLWVAAQSALQFLDLMSDAY